MRINENTKCVLIICETLPCSQQAYVVAVLSMTLGTHLSELIRDNVIDADHLMHSGITRLNLPILATSSEKLRTIPEWTKDNSDIFVVDFTSIVQQSRHYEEYREQLESLHNPEISYKGIGITGDRKKINKLTGNLKLLR